MRDNIVGWVLSVKMFILDITVVEMSFRIIYVLVASERIHLLTEILVICPEMLLRTYNSSFLTEAFIPKRVVYTKRIYKQ